MSSILICSLRMHNFYKFPQKKKKTKPKKTTRVVTVLNFIKQYYLNLYHSMIPDIIVVFGKIIASKLNKTLNRF